ncbi:hypothetical protein ACFE04_026633 [Oxalis oulophora]
MDNLSNTEESNYDLYQPSPSQSTAETPGYSPMSTRDSFAYSRTYSESSVFSDRIITDDNTSYCSEPSPSSHAFGTKQRKRLVGDMETLDPDLEMMKERFSKLLLGEDMSGSGKGVCTAVTISNSITNLYATVFGHNLKLAPLKPEKKAMWKKEMNCLLSVCDFIVELIPAKSQTVHMGSALEVMETRVRADIYINLPALRKLDAMLLEILDSFQDTEFWYAEQGSMSSNSRFGSFRGVIVQRKEDKWWLPVPCVSNEGLSEKSRKHLQHKRACANQIHKAAMAINGSILSEMEIPESYMSSLPKSGRSSLGDSIYNFMSSKDKFTPEYLLNHLKITSEHEALELADRVEASMYTWRRKACMSHSKTSWDMVKDYMSENDRTDKNHTLAERAETLLFYLKQRYPGLSQTTLDICKIQFNSDVGQAILESYSRVLEGLAFNIVAWIDDVIYVDSTMRDQEQEETNCK